MAICDAIIDNVGIFNSALSLDKMQSDKALLWLNFEEEFKEGNFFSYGIGARTYGSVWPDRTPQPEMWQMKKHANLLTSQWLMRLITSFKYGIT